MCYASSQGPGEYDVILTSQPKGGAWGATTVKSALELETERAAKLPGVGRYNIPSCIRTDKVCALAWTYDVVLSSTSTMSTGRELG